MTIKPLKSQLKATVCNASLQHDVILKRRGVLLLVVLSMLTLFVLLGTTYIVFASRTRTTSRAFLDLANEQRLAHGSLRPMIQEAAHQVMRGSSSGSALAPHNLLADRYGTSSRHTITGADFRAAQQLVEIQVSPAVGRNVAGQVLTLLSGYSLPTELEKFSTRIIDYQPAGVGTAETITLVRPRVLGSSVSDLDNTTVLVNQREFKESGFSDTDAAPDFFLPNWSLVIGGPSGHSDEGYDALDAQNMALADSGNTIASYHRQEILDFWIRRYARRLEVALDADYPYLTQSNAYTRIDTLLRQHLNTGRPTATPYEEELLANLRRASIRPFCYDHGENGVDFAGKTISIDTLLGTTFDVDNDGDGSLDSVWTDFGASVFQLPDRTLVKPLAAVRCVDLGGRIGLNTAGSIAHRFSSSGISDDMLAMNRNTRGYEPDLSDLPRTRNLLDERPSGIGFGPADVRLDGILSDAQLGATLFGTTRFTATNSGIARSLSQFVGRYGDGVKSTSDPAFPGVPGRPDQRFGISSSLWPDADIPADWWGAAASPFMGGPPDLWSRLFVGIDHRGHPSFLSRPVSDRTNEYTDYPYELDLTVPRDGNFYAQTGSRRYTDQPFTPVELEAVLRMYDADSAALLPQRMLAAVLRAAPEDRQLLTTETWDTPAVIGPTPLVADVGTNNIDLLAGLRLNLNRPFGDSLDNDGDGIVDEPDETGNNIDDDGNGFIDEPDETGSNNIDDDGDGFTDELDEQLDPYGVAINSLDSDPSTMNGWNLTRGLTIDDQPGPNTAGLRARQIMADNLFRLMDWIRRQFPTGLSGVSNDPGLWLFTLDDPNRSASVAGGLAPLDSNLNSVSSQRTHARRTLAQWAVNVVDFLDADSIMTPYRWTSGDPDENIVWGCEHPDLIVTETLAFHDRGIADETLPDNGPDDDAIAPGKQDNEWDQVRVPQGSLFLELYAMRDPAARHLPQELYDAAGRLRLDRTPTGVANEAPIWRLSMSQLRDPANAPDSHDALFRLTENPDTEWLSPRDSDDGSVIGLDSTGGTIQLDRYVWFTNGTVARNPLQPNAPNEYNTFRNVGNAGGTFSLEPGEYLVVGPRQTTYLGSKNTGLGDHSDQGVFLGTNLTVGASANNKALVSDLNNSLVPVSPPIPSNQDANAWDTLPPRVPSGSPLRSETQSCWVETTLPNDSTAGDAPWSRYTSYSVGLNISEKPSHSYYREPPSGISNAASLPPFRAKPTLSPGTCPSLGYANNLAADPVEDQQQDVLGGSPLQLNNILHQGTHLNVATVFVERLADPTRPHDPHAFARDGAGAIISPFVANPNWNPYIVVDMMPIDLTVFNGETSVDNPTLPSMAPVYFHTRQRGFDDYFDYADFDLTAQQFGTQPFDWNTDPAIGPVIPITATPVRAQDPWRPCSPYRKDRTLVGPLRLEPPLPDVSPAVTGSQEHFNYNLNVNDAGTPHHTLGWCNISWGRRLSGQHPISPEVPSDFDGSPDKPLPWIVWNDRPFASEYELFNVPRTPASRLLTNYRAIDSSIPIANQYDADAGPPVSHHPFGAVMPGHHLLPLSPITDLPVGTDPVVAGMRPRNCDILSRVFSYVRVPSRFAGTTIAIDGSSADTPAKFRPPFNKLPTYREPGRINLNTIPSGGSSKALWRALGGRTAAVDADANSYPDWRDVSSLKQQTVAGATFTNPFQNIPAQASDSPLTDHVPGALRVNPEMTPGSHWYFNPSASLSNANRAELTPRRTSLFAGDASSTPFDVTNSPQLAFDPALSSWFRFEPFIRAASNATSRSEMYAIWVTVGLFEVESVGGTGVEFNDSTVQYPDGYKLLREYGSTAGEVTRRRGFYLFDRSIPVGYESGADHNIQDAILVERFVE